MAHSPMQSDRRFDLFDYIIIASLSLWFVVAAHLPVHASLFGDGYFHQEAREIVEVLRCQRALDSLHIVHAPAPPLYYAIPYAFVPRLAPDRQFWLAAVIWNWLMSVFSMLLIRRAAGNLGYPQAGKYIAFAQAACPLIAYYGLAVLSETPAWLGASIMLYGWSRHQLANGKTRSNIVIASLGMTLLFTSRPNTILLIGLTGLALFVARNKVPASEHRFALRCVVLAVAMMAPIFGWTAYLTRADTSNPQKGFLTHVMIQGAFQFRTEPWDWRHWQKSVRPDSRDYLQYAEVRKQLDRDAAVTHVQVSQLEAKWLTNDLLHHPIGWIKRAAVRCLAANVFLVNSVRPSSFGVGVVCGAWVYRIFHIAINAVTAFFLILSIMFCVRRRYLGAAFWPIWAPWLGLMLFHAVVYVEPRYLFPAYPGLILASMLELVQLSPRWARRATPKVATSRSVTVAA